MGFLDKVKEFFKKLKEENAGFATAMKRINSAGFCGNVNRGIKNGDFWEGSYISIENGNAVIYGSNQEDYVFGAEDVASFELVEGVKCTVSKGDQTIPANRFIITFKDGKRAQADIIPGMLLNLQTTLKI